MTGKILHGECGPIVMASIDDLTGNPQVLVHKSYVAKERGL